MTPLRQRLIEALQLRGLSERTQELSVRAVRHRAEPAHQSPEPRSEEALRPSCLSLNHVTPAARSASTIALCGSPFVSDHPRKRPWPPLTCLRPPQAHPLPVSLSMDAGHTLRQCVRLPRSRACLRTLDAGGLRLQEGTPLQVPASARARRVVHVRHGTGATERSGPRPQRPLTLLRQYGHTHRPPVWRWPAPGRSGLGLSTASPPMPRQRGQGAWRAALQDSGLHQQASGPTGRHSWATPPRAAGGTRRLLPHALGQSAPAPTARAPPLTAARAAEALKRRRGPRTWELAPIACACPAWPRAHRGGPGGGPALSAPCRLAPRAALRPWGAMGMTATPARSPKTGTMPAQIGLVPPASTIPRTRGSLPTGRSCSPCRTCWSPVPCLRGAGRWPAGLRPASRRFLCAVPPPRGTHALAPPGFWGARSACSGGSTPGAATGAFLRTSTLWSPVAAGLPMARPGSPPGRTGSSRLRHAPGWTERRAALPCTSRPGWLVCPQPSGHRTGADSVHPWAPGEPPCRIAPVPWCGWPSPLAVSCHGTTRWSRAPPQTQAHDRPRTVRSRPRRCSAVFCTPGCLPGAARSARMAAAVLATALDSSTRRHCSGSVWVRHRRQRLGWRTTRVTRRCVVPRVAACGSVSRQGGPQGHGLRDRPRQRAVMSARAVRRTTIHRSVNGRGVPSCGKNRVLKDSHGATTPGKWLLNGSWFPATVTEVVHCCRRDSVCAPSGQILPFLCLVYTPHTKDKVTTRASFNPGLCGGRRPTNPSYVS